MNIFTIGYEGASMESFIAALQRERIDAVADVRNSPYSRKKGFSKDDLRDALAENDIEYIGCPLLGVPKEMRDIVKVTGNYNSFFKMYRKLLEYRSPQINELLGLIKSGKRIALLCFEHDAARCHRMVLADQLVELSENILTVVHLNPH
jgi:uncharacterized protein (DUF488 family)